MIYFVFGITVALFWVFGLSLRFTNQTRAFFGALGALASGSVSGLFMAFLWSLCSAPSPGQLGGEIAFWMLYPFGVVLLIDAFYNLRRRRRR